MVTVGELLLVLAALYLVECVIAVHRDALVFWSWTGGPGRITRSANLPGPLNWGLFLGTPLPPLGRLFESQFWPIALSPRGILSAGVQRIGHERPRGESVLALHFEEIESVAADGPFLVINRRRFARFSSEESAREWSDRVLAIRALSESERADAIDAALRESLREDEAKRTAAALAEVGCLVRLAANVLFAVLFVATPLAIYWRGLGPTWPYLVSGLVVVWWGTVFQYRRAHRELHPERRRERRYRTLIMAFTPMAAIRAYDWLSRHALERSHPLAVAAAVCSAEAFREFAQAVLSDLQNPMRSESLDGEAVADEMADWMRSRLRDACEGLVQRAGVDVAELLAAPEPEDAKSRSYCPRCRGEFVHDSGDCPYCGVPLKALGAAAGGPSPSEARARREGVSEAGTSP